MLSPQRLQRMWSKIRNAVNGRVRYLNWSARQQHIRAEQAQLLNSVQAQSRVQVASAERSDVPDTHSQ
jgi:hypothetical protein